MGKKKRQRLRAEYGKPEKVKVKEGKRVKKLTQEQQDILDLARQVLRLEEQLKSLRVWHQDQHSTLASTMRLIEARMRAVSEALK